MPVVKSGCPSYAEKSIRSTTSKSSKLPYLSFPPRISQISSQTTCTKNKDINLVLPFLDIDCMYIPLEVVKILDKETKMSVSVKIDFMITNKYVPIKKIIWYAIIDTYKETKPCDNERHKYVRKPIIVVK